MADDERAASAEAASRAHEAVLAADHRERRRPLGAFYTPPELVDWMLDRALPGPAGPAGGSRREGFTLLDPACGTGHVLVAAARRMGVRSVHGSDLDAEAVAIARARLAAIDPSVSAEQLARQVVVADGLEHWRGRRFDAVVGNPPFLGQLRRATGGRSGGHGLGAYTDTSAVFLHAALDLVADGGVVALVQPLSVLAARDAGGVRAAVAERGAVVDLWCEPRPVFEGTDVLTCVPLVRIGAAGGPEPDAWSALAAPAFGIPDAPLAVATGETVGDLAVCTADFRDQFYGLVPFVADAGPVGPGGPTPADGRAALVTTGLIEPAASRWGRAPTRFARTRLDAPVVDLVALEAEGSLAAWARARLVPKLLVAGQGRVIEAVVDEHGRWLPSVPVLSVVPHDPDDLWRLLALTLAPPLVAHAAARYLGTGLSAGSVKVSARQFATLPLPADRAAWDDGARLARAAQLADPDDPDDPEGSDARADLLRACAATMTRAYGGDPDAPGTPGGAALTWWCARARLAPSA